jgi:hypothetical protein
MVRKQKKTVNKANSFEDEHVREAEAGRSSTKRDLNLTTLVSNSTSHDHVFDVVSRHLVY